MNLKSVIRHLLVIGVIFIVSPHTIAQSHPKTAIQTVYINKKTLSLRSPLLSINGTVYFPIRDIRDILSAEMAYLPKDDVFTIHQKQKKLTLTLAPHSQEAWVNENQQFMPHPVIFIKGRYYAPLRATFALLGYTLKETGNAYHLTQNGRSPFLEPTPDSPLSTTTIATTGTQKKPAPDPFTPPKLRPSDAPYIRFGKNKYPLRGSFIYRNKTLLVDIQHILKKEGFTLSKSANALTFSKNNLTCTITTTSPVAKLTRNGISYKKAIGHTMITQNNRNYIPLKGLMSALSYKIGWNGWANEFYALSEIQEIRLVKQNKKLSLNIISAHPITPSNPDPELIEKGYAITIPHSFQSLKTTRVYTEDPQLTEFYIDQISSTETQISILYNTPLASPKIQTKPYGADLHFYSVISNLKTSISNNALNVHIDSLEMLSATSHILLDPPRLVIDVHDVYSELPQISKESNTVFKRIRTSQFKYDPPITRIVFDLHHPPTYTLSNRKKGLNIAFDIPKSPLPSVPTVVSTPLPKGSLKGKIIVIDAGHGGNDPGAVSKGAEYEKVYVLEIAKKLQSLLKKEGAFVVMTREIDVNPGLKKRPQIANKNKGDILVSIHLNSFFQPFAEGTETYYYKSKDKKLATALQKAMVVELKRKNNGVKRAGLAVLRHSRMPAALVEAAFLTNKKEKELIKTPAFRNRIAQSLHNGIKAYFEAHD